VKIKRPQNQTRRYVVPVVFVQLVSLALGLCSPALSQAARWGAKNPLQLDRPPTGSNPLKGARFAIDHRWGLANRAVRACASSRCSHGMRDVALQPETKRFGIWDVDPQRAVGSYLTRMKLEDPKGVPLLATYALQHKPCHRFSDSLRDEKRYKIWVDRFAAGIGARRAVVFLEMDGLISTHCLNRRGKLRRYRELRYAMARVTSLPHTVVYLDAGSADAHPVKLTAREFVRSGGMSGQGFFLNSTHYNWTRSELRYGQRIVSLLPRVRRFVVSTAVNGRGPLRPKHRARYGNEVRCNPPGRGLGPRATTRTGYRFNDAFAWIGNPGRSTGRCHPGDPATGVFWGALAIRLAERANYSVTGPGPSPARGT